MINIIQDFIPLGRRNRPGHELKPKYITIHDTANTRTGADARAHAQYLKGDKAARAPVSWHFTVDDSSIYQHLPLNESGWHAGDGKNGPGNRQSIAIEICENKDGDRVKAEGNAAWLTAKLLNGYGLGVDAVRQHFDWSGKNCPRVLRGRIGGWSSFLEAVRSHLARRQTGLISEKSTPISGEPLPVQGDLTPSFPGESERTIAGIIREIRLLLDIIEKKIPSRSEKS